MAIDRFRKEHFFLSNMFEFKNGIETPDGVVVHTAEQLYLPPRFISKGARLVLLQAKNGFKAKGLVRPLVRAGFESVDGWDELKVTKMRGAVTVKFAANPDIAEELLATGDEELIEGNDRGDNYWGVSPFPPEGTGQNMLGRILMDTRAAFQDPDYVGSLDIEALVSEIYEPNDQYEGL